MKLVPDNYSGEIVLEETRDMVERLTSNLVEAIKEAEDIKTSFSDDLSRDFLDDLIGTIKPSLTLVRDFEEEFENRFGSSRTSDDDLADDDLDWDTGNDKLYDDDCRL